MVHRAAAVLLMLLGVHYLIWRLGSTLNLAAPLAASLSLTVLGAELFLLANVFLQLAFSLWPSPRPATDTLAAASGSAASDRFGPGDDSPDPSRPADNAPSADAGAAVRVDVLVPSYGEPPALIERCLRGCLAMDYPRLTVWLLDDSGRLELAALCQRLGVRYLHRPERRHAKAGNLNHALAHCRGDLIAVFDADVVPLQGFLRDIVPMFADPRLGFVQTPQSAMNADPVIRNLRLERWLMPDDECFYRWIEPCREAVGAVVCAGTSFVMRREALDRVGGFDTSTPAEDLATGIRITAKGYRNRYLNRKLSAGLAPFTTTAMALQRCRWASGTVQVLRTSANPLTIPGLNPVQRLAYLEGILNWFNVLPQLGLVLLPLSLVLFGVAPILVNGEGVWRHAVPFYAAQLLLARWINRHSRTPLLAELYRWTLLVPLAGAVLFTLLGRPQPFRVTPKHHDGANRAAAPVKRVLLPLLLLLALQGIAALGLLAPVRGLHPQPLSTAAVALAWSWIGANSLLLTVAIRACWPRPGLAPEPWFALALPCRLSWVEGTSGTTGLQSVNADLRAISEAGVELRLRRPGRFASVEQLQLRIPGLPSLPLRLEAESQTGWLGRAGLPAGAGSEPLVGGRWEGLSPAQRERLHTFLYCRPGVWPERRAPLEPLAWLAVLGALIQGGRAETWFQRSLVQQAAAKSGAWDESAPGPGQG
ncbi:MAG: glycosyltransferase [Synechococcaceae cyanobacterium]|nr:glycosyltransferase [Synechococcaceae cyanobacterium]